MDRRRPPRPRRRPRRRRNLRWLAILPLILLAVWLITVNYVFVIRNVEVTGSGSVSAQEVVRASGVGLGSRMNSLNEERIRLNVEADGRLALVGVSRRYPNTAVIAVRERTQDALILQAGKVLVLDSDGYVVSVSDRLPAQSMPYVTGLKPSTYQLGRQLDAADGRLNAMKTVLEALKAQGATEYVSELSVDNSADLRIITRTGMVVLLGNSDNMSDKILWMAGALGDLEARGETVGRLDVSSGSKADFLSGRTATPAPVWEPTPDPYAADAADVPDGT